MIGADNLRIGGENALAAGQTGAIGGGLAGAGQLASRWSTFSNSLSGSGGMFSASKAMGNGFGMFPADGGLKPA